MNDKQRVYEFLKASRGERTKICRETGIEYGWVQRFLQGKIADPGWSKIDTLIQYIERTEAARKQLR